MTSVQYRPIVVLLITVALSTNTHHYVVSASLLLSSPSSSFGPQPSDSISSFPDGVNEAENNHHLVSSHNFVKLKHNRASSASTPTETTNVDCEVHESTKCQVNGPVGSASSANNRGGPDHLSLATIRSPSSPVGVHGRRRRSEPSRPFRLNYRSSLPSSAFQHLPQSMRSRIAARSSESSIRNRFTPWGGKRSAMEPSLLLSSDDINADEIKRGGFQPWGGKRDQSAIRLSNDDEAGDDQLYDDATMIDGHLLNEPGKRAFHPWGG